MRKIYWECDRCKAYRIEPESPPEWIMISSYRVSSSGDRGSIIGNGLVCDGCVAEFRIFMKVDEPMSVEQIRRVIANDSGDF